MYRCSWRCSSQDRTWVDLAGVSSVSAGDSRGVEAHTRNNKTALRLAVTEERLD